MRLATWGIDVLRLRERCVEAGNVRRGPDRFLTRGGVRQDTILKCFFGTGQPNGPVGAEFVTLSVARKKKIACSVTYCPAISGYPNSTPWRTFTDQRRGTIGAKQHEHLQFHGRRAFFCLYSFVDDPCAGR